VADGTHVEWLVVTSDFRRQIRKASKSLQISMVALQVMTQANRKKNSRALFCSEEISSCHQKLMNVNVENALEEERFMIPYRRVRHHTI